MARNYDSANVGITPEQREKAAQVLDRVLADQFVVYVKTRNFHWNVRGPRFLMIHEMLDSQVDQLDEMIDETAEFARYFGIPSLGTMSGFLAASKLSEAPAEPLDENAMLAALTADHESIVQHLRHAIDYANDLKLADLADYFTQIIEKHAKIAWFLRSHLA